MNGDPIPASIRAGFDGKSYPLDWTKSTLSPVLSPSSLRHIVGEVMRPLKVTMAWHLNLCAYCSPRIGVSAMYRRELEGAGCDSLSDQLMPASARGARSKVRYSLAPGCVYANRRLDSRQSPTFPMRYKVQCRRTASTRSIDDLLLVRSWFPVLAMAIALHPV